MHLWEWGYSIWTEMKRWETSTLKSTIAKLWLHLPYTENCCPIISSILSHKLKYYFCTKNFLFYWNISSAFRCWLAIPVISGTSSYSSSFQLWSSQIASNISCPQLNTMIIFQVVNWILSHLSRHLPCFPYLVSFVTCVQPMKTIW